MAYDIAYWISRLLTLSHSERLRCIRYYSMLPNELSEAGLSGSSMPTISEILGDSVEMEGHDTRLTSDAVNEQLDEGEPPKKRMRTESTPNPVHFPNGYPRHDVRELYIMLCEGTNLLNRFCNATLPVDHLNFDDRVEEFDYVYEQCTMRFSHFSRITNGIMDADIRGDFISQVSALLLKCKAKLVEYKKTTKTEYNRDDISYYTHRYNLTNIFIKSEIIGIWNEMYQHEWHN